MPTTAPRRWGRRFRLPALAFVSLAAIAAETPATQLDYLAESLQKGDAAGALAVFDSGIKNFAEIKGRVEALAALSGTVCEIKTGNSQMNGDTAVAETDWKLELNPRQNAPLLIRTGHVWVSMRQIAGEWKIISFTPLSIFDAPDPAVFERIATLASSLSQNDDPGALSLFDSGMQGYGEVSADLDALTSQTDVLCAIDVIADHQSAAVHSLDTDWYLQLQSRADAGPTERRRQRVQLQMEMLKGKWRITSLSPLDILSPLKAN